MDKLESTLPSLTPPPANFQLEEFFLSKLHLDNRSPVNDKNIPVHVNCQFDYTVGVHNVEKNRFRMALKVKMEEIKEDQSPVGLAIDTEIIGFFSLDPSIPQAELELRARFNGLSILYGLLRGVVATTTGVIQGGKFTMPSINAADVIKDVEKRHAAALQKKSGKAKAPSA